MEVSDLPRSHGEATESHTDPHSEGSKGWAFSMKVILWHEDLLIKLVLIWHLPCAETKLGAGKEEGRKIQTGAPPSERVANLGRRESAPGTCQTI